MQNIGFIRSTAARALNERTAIDDARRLGILINPGQASNARIFAEGVETALLWAGAYERTDTELRTAAARASVEQNAMKEVFGTDGETKDDQLNRAMRFSEGYEMGMLWAAGDTPEALPSDMFPVATTVSRPRMLKYGTEAAAGTRFPAFRARTDGDMEMATLLPSTAARIAAGIARYGKDTHFDVPTVVRERHGKFLTIPDGATVAWTELVQALALLAKHPSDDISPFYCTHDVLHVMADETRFTEEEIEQLEAWGFLVDREGGFSSTRYGSA